MSFSGFFIRSTLLYRLSYGIEGALFISLEILIGAVSYLLSLGLSSLANSILSKMLFELIAGTAGVRAVKCILGELHLLNFNFTRSAMFKVLLVCDSRFFIRAQSSF